MVAAGGLCLQTPGSGLGCLRSHPGVPVTGRLQGTIPPARACSSSLLSLPSHLYLFNLGVLVFFFPLMENHSVEPAPSKPGFPAAPWLGRDVSPRELPIRLCQAVSPERGLEPLQFKVD